MDKFSVDSNEPEGRIDQGVTKNLVKWWILSTALFFFGVYMYLTWVRKPQNLWKFSTLTKIPLLGNKWGFKSPLSRDTKFYSDSSIFEKLGTTFVAWRWNEPIVFLADPNNVQKILSPRTQIERGNYGLQECEWMVGKGLLTSKDNVWKEDRKLLTQSFHRNKIVTTHLSVFNRGAHQLMNILQTQAANGEEKIDIENLVARATFENMFESIFGKRSNPNENVFEHYLTASKAGEQVTRGRTFKPYLTAFPLLWKLFGLGKKEAQVVNMVKKLLIPRIRERQAFLQESEGTCSDAEITSGKESLLCDGLFLREKEEQILFNHVVTLFIAGNDTTTNLVVHTLLQLALHPTIQEEVHSELDEIFPSLDRNDEGDHPIESEDLAKVKVMERCLKETLRMFPPASTTSRKLLETVTLEDGTKLRKGCEVRVFPYLLHRNPEFFPQPDQYDPDRFLPDNCAERHPYSYIPFAMGARNCIGNRYAMDQAKVLLINILRQFKVSSSQPEETKPTFKFNFTLQTLTPIMLEFTRRSNT